MRKIISILLFLIPAIMDGQVITTIAGGATGHGGYWGDGGPATAAEIGYFGYVAVNAVGDIYIADGNNQRVRKVDAITGIITTIAGTGIAGYNGDGIPATSAQLNYPGDITFDNFGNIYIIDGNNFRIRKIDIGSGIISTFAGNGIMGSTGDGGAATSASILTGYMAGDNFGNLYILCGRKVRKISPLGIISTVGGTGLSGVTGEGVPATSTSIGAPKGIATDVFGNIYFGDSTSAIRKITVSTGIINRVAGTADNIWGPYSGDGIQATACHIGTMGIAVDDTGNIYNSDFGNHRIEKINTLGIIYSIVGTGSSGYSGDGGAATAAEISFPEFVTLDKCGNVYIADFNNKRVRKVTFHPSCDVTLAIKHLKTFYPSIYPNPTSSLLTIAGPHKITEVTISNLIGQTVYSGKHDSEKVEINVEGFLSGAYLIRINGTEVKRFLKQ